MNFAYKLYSNYQLIAIFRAMPVYCNHDLLGHIQNKRIMIWQFLSVNMFQPLNY